LYKQSLTAKAIAAGDKDVKIELPEQAFTAGTPEYREEVSVLKADIVFLKSKYEELEGRVSSTESNLAKLSKHVDVLEVNLQNYSVDVENIAERMKSKLAEMDAKVKSLDSAHSMTQQQIQDLQQEQAEWKALNVHIRSFNKNPDLRQHYASLVSELEAAYIAAQAIGSEQVDRSKSEKFTKMGQYLGLLASLIPMVGQIASQVIQGFGSMADLYTNVKDDRGLKRIRAIASDMHSFDMIAIHIAVQITLANYDQIVSMNKAVVEPSWRSALGKVADGVAEFVKDNATKAKLLGRAHAQCVISYLQEEGIAVTLAETEVEEVAGYVEEGDSLPKSVPAMIATAVVHELSQRCQAQEAALSSADTASSAAAASVAAADEMPQNTKKKWFRFGLGKKKK
jgi:hypothetical protein